MDTKEQVQILILNRVLFVGPYSIEYPNLLHSSRMMLRLLDLLKLGQIQLRLLSLLKYKQMVLRINRWIQM